MSKTTKKGPKDGLDLGEARRMQLIILFGLIALSTCCAQKEEPFMKTYGGSGPDRGIHIIQTFDDNYVIVGNTMTEANKLDVYLLKCTGSGDTLWTRKFGGQEDDNGWCVKETSDKGYIITGFSQSYNAFMNDVLLLKVDANGKKQWQKTYGGPGYDNAHTVIVNRKQEIILTGYGDYWGHARKMDMFLKQISLKGENIWPHTYGGAENDRAMTVFQTQDDGYNLTGFTQSYGEGDWDAYVIKIGEKGDSLWTRSCGTPAPDFGYDIIQSRKGDYFVTGWSHGFGHPDGDLLFIKLSR